ncbi:TraB/GumN family protein [Candidatus Omnitrophota bacterium]
MIKKLISSTMVFFCSASIVCAQAPEQKNAFTVSPAAHVAQDKSFLWKTSSATNTLYLLGSIHLANKNLYPLNAAIEDAFNASDILVVEVNLNETNPLEVAQKFEKAGTYPPGETLKKYLSDESLTLTKAKLQKLGLDLSLMNHYKPWLLALNVTEIWLLRLGFSAHYGIDSHFMAKASGKKIVELETVDYQINLFRNLTDQLSEMLLVSTLVDLDIIETEMKTLLKAWRQGDTKFVESILLKGLQDFPELLPVYETILYKRNIEMASRIESFFQTDDTYFIVVGAAHLVGDKGILHILKNRGYSFEQL